MSTQTQGKPKVDPNVFTLSKAARGDADGSYKLLFAKSPTETLVDRIKAGIVPAIGSVNQNLTLQWLINPQVHYNCDGKPTHIVGNSSNKKGTFKTGVLEYRTT